MSGRYVAVGSSMAAGPGIKPGVPDAPSRSGRSQRNYPQLVADRLGYELVDVTFSGATTANLLTEPQRGAPPQLDALDGSEDLVTVTIAGNDVGYLPLLLVAGLPRFSRHVPLFGRIVRDLSDPEARNLALTQAAESLKAVGREVRRRAPNARILFVDYLTLLPPHGTPAPPLFDPYVELARHIAETLAHITAEAAADSGCDLVRASEASRDHHAWSDDPWTTGFAFPWPGRVPLHPNAAGMRAVAELVVAELAVDRLS